MRISLLMVISVLSTVAVLYLLYYLLNVVRAPLPRSFTVSGRTFNFTAYATTEQQREHGLMNQSIQNGTFMLFVFPSKAVYSFWMYDTYNSLDIIWLDGSLHGDATVVYIAKNALPCSSAQQQDCTVYTPNATANYVIETRAGFVARYGLVTGTPIKFG